jgi:hypothetical protein
MPDEPTGQHIKNLADRIEARRKAKRREALRLLTGKLTNPDAGRGAPNRSGSTDQSGQSDQGV